MPNAHLPRDTRRAIARAVMALAPDPTAEALRVRLAGDALPEDLYPGSAHGRLDRARDLGALREGRLDDISRLA